MLLYRPTWKKRSALVCDSAVSLTPSSAPLSAVCDHFRTTVRANSSRKAESKISKLTIKVRCMFKHHHLATKLSTNVVLVE